MGDLSPTQFFIFFFKIPTIPAPLGPTSADPGRLGELPVHLCTCPPVHQWDEYLSTLPPSHPNPNSFSGISRALPQRQNLITLTQNGWNLWKTQIWEAHRNIQNFLSGPGRFGDLRPYSAKTVKSVIHIRPLVPTYHTMAGNSTKKGGPEMEPPQTLKTIWN